MTLVATEVFLVYNEVMVRIQLPKATVKHVEVLITKVLSDFVYVIFAANEVQNTEKV